MPCDLRTRTIRACREWFGYLYRLDRDTLRCQIAAVPRAGFTSEGDRDPPNAPLASRSVRSAITHDVTWTWRHDRYGETDFLEERPLCAFRFRRVARQLTEVHANGTIGDRLERFATSDRRWNGADWNGAGAWCIGWWSDKAVNISDVVDEGESGTQVSYCSHRDVRVKSALEKATVFPVRSQKRGRNRTPSRLAPLLSISMVFVQRFSIPTCNATGAPTLISRTAPRNSDFVKPPALM